MAVRSSESPLGRVAWLLAFAVAACLAVYDIFGIWFLIQDHDVVHKCKASNEDVHVIWPTSLWLYVLLSVVLSTAFTVGLLVVPLRKSIDVLERHVKKRGARSRVEASLSRPTLKYGYLSTLPDWLFLMHGMALICTSMVLGVLAFSGYFELFMSRSWCEDSKAAFEELDLWHFGRISFFIQVITASILFCWGMIYWAMPFCFELSEPEDRIGYGAINP